MKIEINAKQAVDALKKMEAVAGRTDSIAVCPDKKGEGIYLTAYEISTSKRATAYIPAKVEGNKNVSLDPNTFVSILKNRKDLLLDFDTSLSVKGKGTRYAVDAVPYKAETVEPVSFSKHRSLPFSVCAAIKNHIKDALVKQIFVEEIYFIIGFKEKYMYLASADNYHAGIVKIKLESDAVPEVPAESIVLPLDYANVIAKMEGEFSISLTGGKVTIQSKSFCADLPSISVPNFNIDYLIGQIEVDFQTSMDSKPIKEFIGNIAGITEETKDVEMILEKDKIEMIYSSSQGRVKDSFPCNKVKEVSGAKCDALHFLDIAKKLAGEVSLHLGKSVVFKTKANPVSYYVTVTK